MELAQEIKPHLFAVRTTGGQEKVVMNLLQNKIKTGQIKIYSVLLVDNLKGYIVVEAKDANAAFETRVIPCWTEGVQKIKVGGKAKLVCPPNLAYGNQNVPGIPPNSTLIFEVELLEIAK